jgi:hypothetical protein
MQPPQSKTTTGSKSPTVPIAMTLLVAPALDSRPPVSHNRAESAFHLRDVRHAAHPRAMSVLSCDDSATYGGRPAAAEE